MIVPKYNKPASAFDTALENCLGEFLYPNGNLVHFYNPKGVINAKSCLSDVPNNIFKNPCCMSIILKNVAPSKQSKIVWICVIGKC